MTYSLLTSYGVPLSAIELYWSSMKTKIKKLMVDRLSSVLADIVDIYRLRIDAFLNHLPSHCVVIIIIIRQKLLMKLLFVNKKERKLR